MKNTEKTIAVELNKAELSFLLSAVYAYGDNYGTSGKVQNNVSSMEEKLWQGIEQVGELLNESK